jgi:hypothetical protein
VLNNTKNTQWIKAKRTTKNSIFLDLFQCKKYLLELYKTIHPEDTAATEDSIDIVTIENVLTDNLYNDLGIIVGGNKLLLLIEAQSTWTMNILIRILLYLAQTYHEYFERTSQSLYKSTKVKIPKPELYIIYTGNKGNKPDVISLSKEFFDGADTDIEIKARVIYESDTDDIVNQYIVFCKVFDDQRKQYGMTEQTVTETIRICKDKNILKEYLESREKEVVTIMMSLFDEEQIRKTYIKDVTREITEKVTEEITEKVTKETTEKVTEEVTEKVTKETAEKTEIETAKRLIKKGKMTLDEIVDCVPTLTLDKLKEIEAEVMQMS